MRTRLVVALGLVACGPATPTPTSSGGDVVISNASLDAGPIERAASCPASWVEARAAAACDPAAATGTCAYAEGDCYCGHAPVCSGVEIDPAEIAAWPTSWQCAAHPPEVRADGCPGRMGNGACAQEGQACWYGDCCVMEVVCRGGAWQPGDASCPP